MAALAVRGIQDGNQPLEEFHPLTEAPDDALSVLRARVTAVPAHAVQACNLVERVLACVSAIASQVNAHEEGPEMYAQRMDRLQKAGDSAGAHHAFERASHWIDWYASL